MAGGMTGAKPHDPMQTLFAVGSVGDLSDAQLLRRFLNEPDAAARAAFAALVERHGPMVLRVCRSAPLDEHDAQDAFQATFLVFARKAGTVRKGESLASWLHGVALRVGARARSDASRRRAGERLAATFKASHPRPAGDPSEPWPELHEEIARLPGHYREPVVLCYLEGLSTEAAAGRIGCPRGTVLSRLSRARERLRSRLIRRGLAPAAAWLAAGSTSARAAALPPSLLGATTRASWEFALGRTTEIGKASALARKVLHAMSLSRLTALGALAVASAVTLGGALAFGGRLDEGKAGAPPVADAAPPVPDAALADLPLDEAARQALDDANAMEVPGVRAEALLVLAKCLDECGRPRDALVALRLALEAAEAIPPNGRYVIPHPAIRIAKAMAEAGQREEAHRAFPKALRIVVAEDDAHQAQSWANLPKIQLEAEGRADSAEMIEAYLRFMKTGRIRPAANPSVESARRKALSGDFPGALQLVRHSEAFRGPEGLILKRSEILFVADLLLPGDREAAGPVLAEARAIVDEFSREKPWFRGQDLAQIALAELRLGWTDRAIATARAFHAEVPVGGHDYSALFQQALAFVEIGKRQTRAGDRAGALDSAREAIAAVGKIQEEAMKPYPLSQACVLLAQNGDIAGAMQKTLTMIPSQRGDALRAIEAEQRKAGDEAGAQATLRLMFGDAEAMLRQSRRREPEAFSDEIVPQTARVATIRARMGDPAAAIRKIETLPPGEPRDEAMALCATELADRGDLAGAREWIGRIKSPRITRQARIRLAFRAAKVTTDPKPSG